MKKNLLKQTTVAALLASTVLSFSPVAMGASSLDQSVNTVKSELSKATTHYVNPSLDGKLAPSSTLYPALNTMKKNYQSVRKSVVSSKLSSSQKAAKLKELDAVYNEKISGGLVPYIDAYNYATKYLVPIMKNIQVAQERNDFATVEKEYHKLSYQLKGRTAILYRFSGKAARDLLLQEYKKPADAKRDELMVPVTIYMSLQDIKDFITAGKMTEAKAEYAEVEALLTRLPSAANNKFITALLEEVAKAKVSLGAVVTPPTGGGGGGGGGYNPPTGNAPLQKELDEATKSIGTNNEFVSVDLVGNSFAVNLLTNNAKFADFKTVAQPVFAVFKDDVVVNSATVSITLPDGTIATISDTSVTNYNNLEDILAAALAKVGMSENDSVDFLKGSKVTYKITGTHNSQPVDTSYNFNFGK